MQKRFKKEFEGSKVTIKSPSIGKVEIDTTAADANKWASIPEFSHMFEDDVPEEVEIIKAPAKKKPAPAKVEHTDEPPVQEEQAPSLQDMTLGELRKKFPDVKANSKKKFLEQIGQ